MINDKKKSQKDTRMVVYGISLITQIGISMMVPIFIWIVIGIFIQNKTGIEICVPLAILLGVITAFRNVYIMTRKMYAKDMDRENKELKYMEDMKKQREQKQAGVKKNGK